MANKLEDLMKLAQNQQNTSGEPQLEPPNQMQGLLQTLAAIAQRTGNPNSERGQIVADLGNTYNTGINQRNKQSFMQTVGQISQAKVDPVQKINALIALKAQHGQDYGLGIDQIVKQFSEQNKIGAGDRPSPVYNYDPTSGNTTDAQGKVVTSVPKNSKINRQGSMFGQSKPDDIANTVSGIGDGSLSPVLTNYSFRDRTQIASGAQQAGLNLNKMAGEYNAVQKFIGTANSATQTRLRQAIVSTNDAIDNLKQISSEFQRFSWTPANKVELMAALSGTDQGKRDIATRYMTQLNVIKDELGQVFMGGNSPTDRSIGLAEGILNKNYGVKQLEAALSELRNNLGYRMNAIDNSGPVVPGGRMSNESYLPQGTPTQLRGAAQGGESGQLQVLTATNKVTKARIKSVDGGKTWQPM